MITKWSISSDGTSGGTVVAFDGRGLGEILDLEITVKPGELTIGRISFVARLESFKAENHELDTGEKVNELPASIEELIEHHNEIIRQYVRKELTEWLGGSFA